MADITSTGALADDPIGGLITVTDGMMHYLTRCCGASGKGSANSSTGVVCRSCYQRVDIELSAGWMVDDDAAWKAYQDRLAGHVGDFAADITESLRRQALARAHESAPGR